VFHRIDINHNGLIDKTELLDGLKNLGIKIGFIGKVLAVFDRDVSGEIGLDEWLSILGEDL
jgi:Ca2+-binding EF-hand superfamily protein